jgi:urea transport system ATP-binding protein
VDIQALIRALPPELTLVMIEHDMDVLRMVVDSAAVLHLGTVVAQGPIREIQDDERVRELYLGRAATRRRTRGTPGEGDGGA